MTEIDAWDSMAEVAVKNGWEADTVPDLSEYEISGNVSDLIWRLYAKRDQESLIVEWRGLTQVKATYNYGDYYLNPAWRAGAIKLLEGKPNPTKFAAKDKGKFTDQTYEEIIKTREVPWESDDCRAFDILIPVLGSQIHWVQQSQFVDTYKLRDEHCPKESNLGKNHFRVFTTSRALRVLEWANSFGFQACYVHNILKVIQ